MYWGKVSKNKYKNKKVTIDNIEFDSIKESQRYIYLKLLKNAGQIKNLELQKEFELVPNFKLGLKSIRKMSYIADFYYYDNRLDCWIVEDVKGFRTDVYKLKKKLFEYKYKIEIKEV